MIKSLITGTTGQDGSFLAELLLNSGHQVYGIIRRSSSFNTERIDHIYNNPNLKLIYGDLSDSSSIGSIIGDIKPDYFYNLGAQSHVKVSFDIPEYTADTTGMGTIRCLEAIRKYSPQTRFYQASSSELFGSSPPPQNELTPFHPRSPYGVAKLYAYWITINYRESYGIFGSNGILFNHSGVRRGETFISRKVTRAVGRIKYGLQKELHVGNIQSKRDWSSAKDCVEAQKLIIEYEKPDDFVIASGEAHSIKELIEKAFDLADLDPYKYLVIDPKYYRPAEVDYLLGDPTKAKTILHWEPKYSFDDLVKEMVEYDLELARKEYILKNS